MVKQIDFILREIDEKTADDPKKERTSYKFTPDNGEIVGDVELKIKTKKALNVLGFGVKNKQSKLGENVE